ncbi:MAG: HEPN domain-containing protein [Thermoflexibacter sp.]|jgi:uncharacterized protein (UPF0332 family)|nr:HEPN domain-containing protein [Thermoflexibacter sp.]
MSEEISKIIARADDFLLDAQENDKIQRYLAVVNRAYYAIFTAAQALLFQHEVFPKTHQGTMIKFNELFIKSKVIPYQYSLIFNEAFELRQNADYDFEAKVSSKEAKELLEQAESFLSMTKQYFENLKED